MTIQNYSGQPITIELVEGEINLENGQSTIVQSPVSVAGYTVSSLKSVVVVVSSPGGPSIHTAADYSMDWSAGLGFGLAVVIFAIVVRMIRKIQPSGGGVDL